VDHLFSFNVDMFADSGGRVDGYFNSLLGDRRQGRTCTPHPGFCRGWARNGPFFSSWHAFIPHADRRLGDVWFRMCPAGIL